MEQNYDMIYNNIIHKYDLNKLSYLNDNLNNDVDKFINNLNNTNKHIIKEYNNNNYFVHVSNRLIIFLSENDYHIDNILLYKKLYSKILTISEIYHIIRLKNVDIEILNDIKSISLSNYLTKKVLITNFINKYTSKNKVIHINI
jgi:hypothetical protein